MTTSKREAKKEKTSTREVELNVSSEEADHMYTNIYVFLDVLNISSKPKFIFLKD